MHRFVDFQVIYFADVLHFLDLEFRVTAFWVLVRTCVLKEFGRRGFFRVGDGVSSHRLRDFLIKAHVLFQFLNFHFTLLELLDEIFEFVLVIGDYLDIDCVFAGDVIF